MKSIWLQEKIVGGEFLDAKYMAARKICGWRASWVKSIWLQEKFVGGEFLGEKYMAARKIVGGELSG